MIERGMNEDGSVRFSKNKGKRYVVTLLEETVLGMDEAKGKAIIKTWMKSGVVYEDKYINGDSRHEEPGLYVDLDKLPKDEV